MTIILIICQKDNNFLRSLDRKKECISKLEVEVEFLSQEHVKDQKSVHAKIFLCIGFGKKISDILHIE